MSRDYNLIAVGIDQDGRIFKAHFGMACKYLVFNRNMELVREVENPHALSPDHHDDPGLITALLPDVGIFIAHRMGKVSRERLHNEFHVRTYLTEEKEPVTAVQGILSRDTE